MAHKDDDLTATIGPGRISEILQLGLSVGEPYRPEELRAFLEHELASPLAFDLGSLAPEASAQLRALCTADGMLLKSFGDLLQHPAPPVRALELAKDFAKTCSASPHGAIPQPVARVLYYACIAAALLRGERGITKLPDEELARGLAWVLAQPWLTEATRALVEKALAHQASSRKGGG